MKSFKFKPLVLITLFIMLFLPVSASALDINAEAYILLDMESGEVLAEKNTDEVLYMASLTKIMTAYVVLSNVDDLDQEVTSSKTFMNVGESSAGILPNETHTYMDLLYALLIKSANDAAQVLAYGVAGSESLFVEMMNETAQALGMYDTHFVNPHGLHDSAHYTTVNDLVTLTKAALKFDVFRYIVSQPYVTLDWNGEEITFYSTNQLFGEYEGIKGVKTGYTSQAGNCLVALCERDGMELLAVILKAEKVFEQMPILLDYGFDNFRYQQVYEGGEFIRDIPVKDGKTDSVPVYVNSALKVLLNNEIETAESEIFLPQELEAPVQKGDVVGHIEVQDGFGNVFDLDVVAGEDCEQHTFAQSVKNVFAAIFSVFTRRVFAE